MGSLSGKVAIVAGAGCVGDGLGNGRAIALQLARDGAFVAVIDISETSAERTREMIDAEGGDALVVVCDVSDQEACGTAVEKVVNDCGRLDILVNGVGVAGPPGTAESVDPEQWAAAMATNVTSIMLMSRHCIPRIREVGGGSILNIASIAGMSGGYPHLFYPASKAAVINMTQTMAVHHAEDRIRVNCIAPGLVFTPRVEVRGITSELRRARIEAAPLKVEGTALDVAAAAAFLLSDDARWITGVIVPVDGGLMAGAIPH